MILYYLNDSILTLSKSKTISIYLSQEYNRPKFFPLIKIIKN